jgi:hypothetical protein
MLSLIESPRLIKLTESIDGFDGRAAKVRHGRRTEGATRDDGEFETDLRTSGNGWRQAHENNPDGC